MGIEKLGLRRGRLRGAEDEGGPLPGARGIFMYAGRSKSMPEYVPVTVTF
jgi:hypothetical protein